VTSRDYNRIALKYARDLDSGRIPAGAHAIAAARRHIGDLARWRKKSAPYHFDPESATRACRFIELLPHIKGPLAGELIHLEPWQIFVLCCVFGWKRRDGLRRFRRVYIEVPRGNGKSALSSAVALYMLCADKEGGAECYSFATTGDQAKIVFGDARSMALRTPGLRRHFGVDIGVHNLNVPLTGSKLEAKSSEGSTLDGLNTHFACIDELHAHKTRVVYDVVETSIGKRSQPLLWVITTAGSNRSGICYEVRGFAIRVLDGRASDESQFSIIYGLDDGDDWTTEAALVKANPNWGVSVIPDTVRSLQAKAMAMASAANNFRTKHCNDWVNADTAWLDMRAWDRCADPTLAIEDFAGRKGYLSLDLASKVDIAARIAMFPEPDGSYAIFGKYYLPRDTVEMGENAQYSGWEAEGRLTVTEGAVIDFDVIEQDVIDDCRIYDVTEVPYDPFQATQLSTRLMAQGIPMVEVRPTVLNFSEPMKLLGALVLEGKIRHNGCPILTWMMSNVVCHTDAKDNIYPRKERPENKIDGVVAAIMALARAIANEAQADPGMMFVD
jgi:phage terminase large subunit-like protein